MTTYSYSPDDIILVFNQKKVTGFAKGTFITVERDTEDFKDDVGSTGDVVQIQSLDLRGKITVTLLNRSPSNDDFSSFLEIARAGGKKRAPVMLEDLNGTTLDHGDESWIERPAKHEYGDEHTPTEWVIRVAKLKMYVGGALS